MNEIKEAGWVRFKPVEGQPINDKDIKKVFKMVDMDKSGAISQLVNNEALIWSFHPKNSSLGTKDGTEISGQEIPNRWRKY